MTATLGGKTLDELGLRLLREYQRPVAPSTRDYTMEIAGRHGAWDFGADLGPREFALTCALIDETPSGLQAAIGDVTAHLFDATGRPRNLSLVFDDEPEKSYTVRYSGSLPIERLLHVGKFDLPLVAFDPFKYAPSTAYDPAETYLYDTGRQYDSGLMYDNPPGFDWRYSRQRIGLYNYSDQNTPIRVVVQGSVINPRITNETTGTRLTIGSNVQALLEADTDRYFVRTNESAADGTYFLSAQFPAAYTNTATDRYLISEQYGDFSYLAPGKNSLLLEGGIPNAQVFIEWQHKFI